MNTVTVTWEQWDDMEQRHALYRAAGDDRQPAYDVAAYMEARRRNAEILATNPELATTLFLYNLKMAAWFKTCEPGAYLVHYDISPSGRNG